MRLKLPLSVILIFLLRFDSGAQSYCTAGTRAFEAGEELNYKVTYNWGLVWLESAFAKFTVEKSRLNARACYYFRGEGSTYKNYDWFYKVRDVFESWVDTADLRPLKFSAVMNEGSKHDKHTYLFDDRNKRAFTVITRGKKPAVVDTVKQGTCTIDVLSAIYYARSYDYSKCKLNDTISMSQLLDGKVYSIYVRYLGKANYTSEELGTFKCIKFSPLLIEGSIFKKGEGMTVWVTDDENKLPLYIETPIVIGTIKVWLTSYKGLRFPIRARIN